MTNNRADLQGIHNNIVIKTYKKHYDRKNKDHKLIEFESLGGFTQSIQLSTDDGLYDCLYIKTILSKSNIKNLKKIVYLKIYSYKTGEIETKAKIMGFKVATIELVTFNAQIDGVNTALYKIKGYAHPHIE